MKIFNDNYDTFHYPVIVFVLLLTLKLTGTIHWTWLAVTSPLWFVGTLNLIILVIQKTFFDRRSS